MSETTGPAAEEGHLLVRVFLGESDREHGKVRYERIVEAAREDGLAGATVLRGILGFGAHHRLHAGKFLSLADNLPVVVELVDRAARVEAFLPRLRGLAGGALVTVEAVRVAGGPRAETGPAPGAGERKP